MISKVASPVFLFDWSWGKYDNQYFFFLRVFLVGELLLFDWRPWCWCCHSRTADSAAALVSPLEMFNSFWRYLYFNLYLFYLYLYLTADSAAALVSPLEMFNSFWRYLYFNLYLFYLYLYLTADSAAALVSPLKMFNSYSGMMTSWN